MTHVQTHTPTAVVLSGSHPSIAIEGGLMGSDGGVALELPEAIALSLLPTSGLRCIEIVSAPALETLDLRALDLEALSLQLRGCSALKEVLLGEKTRAHIHLDAGASPPASLLIDGHVHEFGACWGDGYVSVNCLEGGSLHFGSALPAATAEANTVVLAQPTADVDGVLRIGEGLEATSHLVLTKLGRSVAVIQWNGHHSLKKMVIRDAPAVLVVRAPVSLDQVEVADAPLLRVISTEDHIVDSLILKKVTRVAAMPSANTPHQATLPRARPCLVIDVPARHTKLFDSGAAAVRVFHPTSLTVVRCPDLTRLRVDEHTRVSLEDTAPPINALDRLTSVAISAELIAALEDRVRRGQDRAWDQLNRLLKLPMNEYSLMAALKALLVLSDHRPLNEIWTARTRLYTAQTGRAAGFAWKLPRALATEGYRVDYLLMEKYYSHFELEDAPEDEERGLLKILARQITRHVPLANALLPWLVIETTALGFRVVKQCLVEAVFSTFEVPTAGISAVSAALLHSLQKKFDTSAELAEEAPMTFFMAKLYFTSQHIQWPTMLAWLEWVMQSQEDAARVQIAEIREQRRPRLTPAERHDLRHLLRTGQLPDAVPLAA
jgi:hypothetical protein